MTENWRNQPANIQISENLSWPEQRKPQLSTGRWNRFVKHLAILSAISPPTIVPPRHELSLALIKIFLLVYS